MRGNVLITVISKTEFKNSLKDTNSWKICRNKTVRLNKTLGLKSKPWVYFCSRACTYHIQGSSFVANIRDIDKSNKLYIKRT